jgi:predicted transcriptional regulator
MFLPVNEKQFEFWILRRNGLPNINIAKQFGISRQAVSRALLSMDKRIEETLLEMARANRIEVEKLDSKKGILFGRSIPVKADTIIFASVKHGIQVWYEHEGECEACERYRECIELLWDFAEEMNLKLQSTEDPTKIADELFRKLKELVE